MRRLKTEMVEAVSTRSLTMSGSLLAIDHRDRIQAAAALLHIDAWVHADVIDGCYGSRPSVGLDQIHELAAGGPDRIDVHLMVDDPVSWCNQLPAVQRISVQVHAGIDLTATAAAARGVANELWWAADSSFLSGAALARFLERDCDGTRPDGFLVLLTPPGQSGFALDPARLADVRTARSGSDAVGVDGGVNLISLDAVVATGARYIVCGRSLFDQPHVDQPHAYIESDSGL